MGSIDDEVAFVALLFCAVTRDATVCRPGFGCCDAGVGALVTSSIWMIAGRFC